MWGGAGNSVHNKTPVNLHTYVIYGFVLKLNMGYDTK